MPPETINLIIFAEQMAALLAKTIVDLKMVIQGSHTQDVNTILDDADRSYAAIIANAKSAPPIVQGPSNPPVQS